MNTSSPRKKRKLDTNGLLRKDLEREGYTIGKVEVFAPPGIYRDFLGLFDYLCLHPDHKGYLGIQGTSIDHMHDRWEKMSVNLNLILHLQTGNRAQVRGWRHNPGQKMERRIWNIELDDSGLLRLIK